jgi:hypothetical protein
MRLAFALVSSLVLTASTAFAADPATGQGDSAPQADRAQPAQPPTGYDRRAQQDRHYQDAEGTSAHRVRFPQFSQDKTTDAYCYYVYGDLRCDRVEARPSGAARP